ncbi:MAG: hypothetical protein HOP96_04755 [Sphingomonas sp.]|nr:hypothetical protein [Sphingomonas sp.]
MDEQRLSPPPVDRGKALIAAAILGGALVLSWGVSGNGFRYQIAASGDTVVRLDTDSGEMIACNRQRCTRVESPDRAKTFGPLTIHFDSKETNALAASNETAAREAP